MLSDDAAERAPRRALLDDSSAVAVSLRVDGLPVSDAVTVIFHARRDLGTLQTYVAYGSRGAGATVPPASCCACPATSTSPTPTTARRPSACTSSRPTCCATRSSAPTSCSTSGASRSATSRHAGHVDHSVELAVRLPAPRLLPTALVAQDSQLVVTPVCGARTLAEGRPPLGIACAQQDFTRVYPLADDPERCVEDFLEVAAEHARALAERLDHQEASVERFLEISDTVAPVRAGAELRAEAPTARP